MSQPIWKLIAQLGDVNPLDHGGYFIYEDTTGVYPPEGEILEVVADDADEAWADETKTHEVRRFSLDRCTLTNGILSDNKFHLEHPAWFATPEAERAKRPQDTTYLSNVADSIGQTLETLTEWLCSESVTQRAEAYRAIGGYHGFDNLDSYPLQLTLAEAKERYKVTA